MSTYNGTTIKDLDTSTPTEGAVGTIPEFNDCMRETKKVLKNQNSITTITGDTTLDATHSTVIINKATAIVATLPTASTVASSSFIKEYYFKNIGAGTLTVTGTVILNGTSTVSPTLLTNDEMRIWSEGTNWYGVKYSATAAANTVPVSDVNGFLSIKNPCFSVHKNSTNQTVNGSSYDKITWSTELWDTNSNFDSDRFTPTIAGKYCLFLTFFVVTGPAPSNAKVMIYKNGAVFKTIINATNALTSGKSYSGSCIIDANGSTDYFEVYFWHDSGTAQTIDGRADLNYFEGVRIGI